MPTEGTRGPKNRGYIGAAARSASPARRRRRKRIGGAHRMRRQRPQPGHADGGPALHRRDWGGAAAAAVLRSDDPTFDMRAGRRGVPLNEAVQRRGVGNLRAADTPVAAMPRRYSYGGKDEKTRRNRQERICGAPRTTQQSRRERLRARQRGARKRVPSTSMAGVARYCAFLATASSQLSWQRMDFIRDCLPSFRTTSPSTISKPSVASTG